jgi:arginyl-tRNA synthetase
VPIRDRISSVIREAVATFDGVPGDQLDALADVDYGRDDAHGDLTTPVAMRVRKFVGGGNPREIGEKIAAALHAANDQLDGAIDRVEVAGPGFLNIYLGRRYWQSLVQRILIEGRRYGRSNVGKRRKVQIEFASANPTGPLSVAHGRQAAIGDVLANILKFIGFDVATEYWLNDCGNQINRLGESVWVRYCQALGDTSARIPKDGYHGTYIIEMGHDLAAKQGRHYMDMPRAEAIDTLGRFAVSTILRQILADFQRFGIEHDRVFSQREFEAEGHVERLLDRMKQAGLAYEQDGAVWIRTTDHGDSKDRVLVKSDGSWAYRLSDVAYHEDKFDRGFDQIIDMLGPDHHGHIITMQSAMKALGHPVDGVRFLVVQHCTILRDGIPVKMSTRAGQLITLDEVIEDVGVDVARFFFLTLKTDSHLNFDLELAKQQSLDNPVYYIQYAHARIASILRKAEETGRLDPSEMTQEVYAGGSPEDLDALEDRDLALARKLGRLGAVLEKAGLELEPHRLTNYLHEVAGDFQNYYHHCPVIGDDERLTRARLRLVSAVRVVLGNALHLLGVHIPETM